jgi:hypothetical protein
MNIIKKHLKKLKKNEQKILNKKPGIIDKISKYSAIKYKKRYLNNKTIFTK